MRALLTALLVATAGCGTEPTKAVTKPADDTAPRGSIVVFEKFTTMSSITVEFLLNEPEPATVAFEINDNKNFVRIYTLKSVTGDFEPFTFDGLACGRSFIIPASAYDTAGNFVKLPPVSARTLDCPPIIKPDVEVEVFDDPSKDDGMVAVFTLRNIDGWITAYLAGNGYTGSVPETTKLSAGQVYTRPYFGLKCGTLYRIEVFGLGTNGARSDTTVKPFVKPCPPP